MKILRILSFSEPSCICARGIVLSFDIGLWKCSDCVVILEVFRLCGYFGSVPTVWLFWKCSDCVVILEVFRLCGYFESVLNIWKYGGYYHLVSGHVFVLGVSFCLLILGFESAPAVWLFCKCSDCVVILEVFRLCGYFGSVPTVWLFFVFRFVIKSMCFIQWHI